MCFCLSVAYILKIYIILLMSPQSIYKIKKNKKKSQINCDEWKKTKLFGIFNWGMWCSRKKG